MLCRFRCSDVRSIDRAHSKSDQDYVSQHRLQEPAVTGWIKNGPRCCFSAKTARGSVNPTGKRCTKATWPM
ncbi:Bgt-51889 [Blumeria graminis f. sp. tritici]|uniref:Bgt-51889 n=1 Tax=Blumeria graminis f. sp. tritici TaxID=62690 RepID=A0A9X9LBP0_BLUGR|nr:Bgt-51889 [Blumeria graminis f. sp. tritici]